MKNSFGVIFLFEMLLAAVVLTLVGRSHFVDIIRPAHVFFFVLANWPVVIYLVVNRCRAWGCDQ